MASITEPYQIARLEHAYRVLGVLPDTSALQIKLAYHRLARRWHPDKFTHDSPQQRHATERMREINDAFQLIKRAPLRFRRDVPSEGAPTMPTAERRPPQTAPVTDIGEYIVRFATGAAVGLYAGLRLYWAGAPLAIVGFMPLAIGGGAVVFGDRFWHWFLMFWWL